MAKIRITRVDLINFYKIQLGHNKLHQTFAYIVQQLVHYADYHTNNTTCNSYKKSSSDINQAFNLTK